MDDDGNSGSAAGRNAAVEWTITTRKLAIRALDAFLRDLDLARAAFEVDRGEGIRKTVRSMHDYLAVLDPQDILGHRGMVVVLMISLDDLQTGAAVPDWLKGPPRKRGQPPLPTGEMMLRATVAAIAARMTDAGLTRHVARPEAASRLAKVLRECGVEGASRDAVAAWIKVFLEGGSPGGVARPEVLSHYRQALAYLQPIGPDLAAVEQYGFAKLREMVARFRFGKSILLPISSGAPAGTSRRARGKTPSR